VLVVVLVVVLVDVVVVVLVGDGVELVVTTTSLDVAAVPSDTHDVAIRHVARRTSA